MSTKNKGPVYLMAGGRSGNGEAYKKILNQLFQDIGGKSPQIAYVGAASEDDKSFFKMIQDRFKSVHDCKVTHAVTFPDNADIKLARKILEQADAVFISGGDVELGMDVLLKKDLVNFICQLASEGKVFFGLSAGSIMLAKEWVRWSNPDDDSTAELFPCLGLAPVICDTHAEEDDWVELKAALQLEAAGTVGYGIATNTCLRFTNDGKIESAYGRVQRFVHRQNKVEKLTDLIPDMVKP